MKIKNMALICIFALLLGVGSLLCIVKPADIFSETERRQLASFPKFSLEQIQSGQFMQEFETYAVERFPYRDIFRSIKAFFATDVLKKKDNNGLFVYQGHISKLDSPKNEDMMNHAADVITYLKDTYTNDKNCSLYVSVIPDKNALLGAGGYPSLDYPAFAAEMREKLPEMTYIDLSDLLSLSDYYTTDTHWRQENIVDVAQRFAEVMGTKAVAEYDVKTLDTPFYGVYYGQLAKPFAPDTISYVTNQELEDCVVTYYENGVPKEGNLYVKDKAEGKDPYEFFLSGAMPLITIQNPHAQTDKELVMFRDSYSSSLAPLLIPGYTKITLVDVRYMKSQFVGRFVSFENADVLFCYSTALLNNSLAMQ